LEILNGVYELSSLGLLRLLPLLGALLDMVVAQDNVDTAEALIYASQLKILTSQSSKTNLVCLVLQVCLEKRGGMFGRGKQEEEEKLERRCF
jgi:hypothetical protein